MRKFKLYRKFILVFAIVLTVVFSVGYSALSSSSSISGSMRYNVKKPVRVTGIALSGTASSGTEQFSPSYNWNTTTTGVNLPNLSSTVTYAVTIRNYGSDAKGIKLDITSNSNSSMTYTVSNMPSGNTIAGNSTVTINITVKYGVSTLPDTKTDTMTITYSFLIPGAMFNTGTSVNAKMKKFVSSSATYNTQDTTITNIQRYTGTPSSTYLVDANIVSSSEYYCPIYMWYDSSTTTIYWYTVATSVYFNSNSGYFFSNLRALNSIANLNDISTTYTTSMAYMFYYTGYSSTSFTLSLGSNFNTANVTDMNNMFAYAGHSSTAYTLSLGSYFDTTNVTNMSNMFRNNGYSSTSFTLSLGSKFNTTKVTNMNSMFYNTGYANTSFTLSLGSYFNTGLVTNMNSMFYNTGYNSTTFTLSLGSNFNTENVTNMQYMFRETGRSSTSFTLNLGSKFDTSKVTNMSYMFNNCGRSSTSYTLNLGSKFNTALVENMTYMFGYAGYSSTSFTLSLGSLFDTTNVTDMSYMFYYTGYANTSFTLSLGSKFNTAKVTTMSNMFAYTGHSSTSFTLSLGSLFDTSNVTTMSGMFRETGYSSTSFASLPLGSKFNTSKVTSMSYMFNGTGYTSTSFTLSLGSLFDTSSVTNMAYMFSSAGRNSTSFTLSLGSKFDTSNVTNMSYMFRYLGYSNSSFTTLELGDKFNTSKVTNMNYMFANCRYLTTIYAYSVFVTTAVTSSTSMFSTCTNLVGSEGTAYSSSHIDATYAHIDGGTSNPGYLSQHKYYIDLNGKLDGTTSGNLGSYGKCDVKINGTTESTGVTDYYKAWPTGTTYQFTCSANTGFTYGGVDTGSLSGTVGTSNTSVRVIFTSNSYTITYNVNGGTSISNGSYTVLDLPYTLPVATKSGSLFGGWYTSSGLTGSPVTQIPTGTTGNKTYYAKWITSGYQGYTTVANYSGSSDDGTCNGNTPSGYTAIKCVYIHGTSDYEAKICMYYKAVRISPTAAEVHVYTRQWKNNSGYYNGYFGLANTVTINSTSMTPTDTTCQTSQAGVVTYSGPNGSPFGQTFTNSIRYRNLSLDYKFNVATAENASSVTLVIGQKYCGESGATYCTTFNGTYTVTIQ